MQLTVLAYSEGNSKKLLQNALFLKRLLSTLSFIAIFQTAIYSSVKTVTVQHDIPTMKRH